MRRVAATSLPFVLLALLPAAALGGEKRRDARIDPNSPAGTEYAIPFERAREEAGRGRSGKAVSREQRGGAEQVQKEKAAPGSGAKPRKRDSGGKGRRRAKASQDTSRPAAAPPPAAEVARSVAKETRTGVSTALWTVGLPLGVVLGGGLIGFGLRRQRARL